MNTTANNNRGFAIVYALVVLLLASVGGTALLFLTRKDHIDQSDYAGMRTASHAAVAALKACEAQFLNDPPTALNILNKYTEDNSYKWMLYSSPTNGDNPPELKLWDGTDAPSYRAEIKSYDATNHVVLIEGTGILPNGGEKSVLAAYRLGGIKDVVTASINTTYGLFLGSGLENLNRPATINSDVYFSMTGNPSKIHHLNGGSTNPLVINGNFKTGTSDECLEIGAPVTINGNALFRCKLWGNSGSGPLSVPQKAGFTNGQAVAWGSPLSIDFSWSIGIMGYFLDPQAYVFYDKTPVQPRTKKYSANDVAIAVGMENTSEATFSLNLSALGSATIKEIGSTSDYKVTVSGGNVNTWYTENDLFSDDWLVIKPKCRVEFTNSGSAFSQKTIWLIDGISIEGTMFECTNTSNTLICVYNNGHVDGLTFGSFRGMVFVDSDPGHPHNYGFTSGKKFYGAIHHKQGQFNITAGTGCELQFQPGSGGLGETALQEIVNTGVVLGPGVTETPVAVPTVIDKKIRPTLAFMEL